MNFVELQWNMSVIVNGKGLCFRCTMCECGQHLDSVPYSNCGLITEW